MCGPWAQFQALVESLVAGGTPPADIAAMVADAIAAERFWILPHPRQAEAARARVEGMLAGTNPAPSLPPS